MNDALLESEEHVLSTMERDGSRRWLKPRLSKGSYLRWRRVVAYLLIALYSLLPFIEVGGRPFVLLDIPDRRFIIFGFTFLPTDTLLLALFMVGSLLGIFLLTAVLGRVWCGWACPQTVYMEFVFRPIERFFDRTIGRGGVPRKLPSGARKALRFAVYVAISFALTNTFVAYFVGVEALGEWMTQSPIHHPLPFAVMAVMTAAMVFHFSYFREQLCIIACPYGRLQSVLLDDSSLVVAYDVSRGEPRGKRASKARKSLPVLGDCVDCKLCVQTCPTGIDIREGLQMECVNCTQCIDACDAVMRKLDRPTGLIRYSSTAAARGEKTSFLRPRVIIYPAIIALITGLFFYVLLGKSTFDAVLLRNTGQPFTTAEDGRIRNVLRIKLSSRSEESQRFDVQVVEPAGLTLDFDDRDGGLVLAPGEVETFPISVLAAPELYVATRGQVALTLRIVEQGGTARNVNATLLGPETLPRPTKDTP